MNLSMCWLAALLALPLGASGQAASNDERYIVTFRSSASADDRRAADRAAVAAGSRAVDQAGGRVLRELPSVRSVAAWLPEEALQDLRRRPDVELIEVDARRYLVQSGPPWSDTSQNGEITPYGIWMVQADQLSGLSDAAAGNRKVCIIDTGYNRGHDDLQYAHVTATPDAATGDPFVDPHGHGTHVAGTIAAAGGNGIGVRGVNPSQRINLHIIKAFGKTGNWAYSSDVIHALAQCRTAGAHVISMSFSSPQAVTAEETAFADAYAAGILSIAAAGNDGVNSHNYPASYPSVVSVAAVDANEDRAAFSQINDQVELAGPGVSVLSTLPPPYGYAAWSGTSMATPHVAGVAALVWSYNPSWTNAQIRQALQQTAKDKGDPGRDLFFGYGIVQAKDALDFLCSPGCVPPPSPPAPASDCLVDTGEGDFTTGQGTNVDVTSSPGDVRLSSSFVEQAENVSSAGVGFTTTTWRAQTFTAGVTGTLTAAEIYLSCEGCNGAYFPQIEISVRETDGGLPIAPDLATAHIFGFVGAGWQKAEFAAPATLEAGRQYALVVRTWLEDVPEGGYHWLLNDADTYAGGRHWVSTNSGSSWSSQSGADLSFRLFLSASAGPYNNSSGWLTSSLEDSLAPAGATVLWGTLSWTATVPAGTSISFQVAVSDSAAGPFDFVGPDGTAATFFTTSGASVGRFGRYLRYRAVLATFDPMSTPVLHDVTTCFTTVRGEDAILRGTVTDALTGGPLGGVSVDAGAYSATTDASGRFEIGDVTPGTYTVTVSAGGYISTTLSSVPVFEGFVTSRDVALLPLVGCVTDTSQADFAAGTGSNVDRTSAAGDVLLALNNGTLDQSQTSTGSGYGFPTTAWYQAQTFTPAASGFLRRLQVGIECFDCSGADPDITVEIRNAVSGAPGHTVLATATIAGFSSPTYAYYTVTFESPPPLTAGTQYAFVLRLQTIRTAGFYYAHASQDYVLNQGASDRYGGGTSHTTTDGGTSWNAHTSDLAFRTYMATGLGKYLQSGTLASATKDGGSWARWTSLSWTTTSSASTAVRFQVEASSSPSGPFAFVGPDGTANTFFTTSGASLAQLATGRYAKYKAFLSSSDAAVTPVLHDATLCYELLEDTAPPSAPGAITSSHDGGSGFGDDTIAVAWGAAIDALSGVDGYSYFFDQRPVTACETTKDVEEVTLQATSGALADGTWYVHVCAVDQAGSWGAVAHGGPYVVATPCLTDTTLAHFQAGVGSNVDLTSTPGDVQLTLTPATSGTLDQAQTALGDTGWAFSAAWWEAQTFTPATSGFLTRLDVNLSCWDCYGDNPVITVEIRNVVGSAPGDTVLATATFAGFSSPVPAYYTAVFGRPPALTAGTQYAFVVSSQTDRVFGRYGTSPASGGLYSSGAHRYTVNQGAPWFPTSMDVAFRTYMAPAPGVHAASGTLVSAVKGRWSSLAWTATSPQSTTVKFQVAASNSASGPFTFVGPDGTPGSFFTTSASIGGVAAGQYMKYKAFLNTGNAAVTPALHDVTVCSESAPSSAGSFFTVKPCRLLDTRQLNQGPALASGVPRLLAVPGACGVPPTATAVAINVTVTQASGAGHLVIYPGGAPLPATSTLNFGAGQTRANNAVVALGAEDSLALSAFASGGSVHVVVDVVGYFE